jgi:hypothetical protein
LFELPGLLGKLDKVFFRRDQIFLTCLDTNIFCRIEGAKDGKDNGGGQNKNGMIDLRGKNLVDGSLQ